MKRNKWSETMREKHIENGAKVEREWTKKEREKKQCDGIDYEKQERKWKNR